MAVPARPAASVVLLRDSAAGPEALLVRRTPAARFMGGAWVFPGGAIDPQDAGPAEAAVRELAEEAGICGVAPEALVPFSRWITPEASPIRFDTWFFLARAPEGARPAVDGREVVDHLWSTPEGALAAHAEDRLPLSFPTAKHLEELAGEPSAAALLAAARERVVEPVLPRMAGRRVILPGEPDYDRGPQA